MYQEQALAMTKARKLNKRAAPSYENPISRKKEKALATLSVIGGSAVLGAVVGGLVSCLKIGTKKSALIGVGTAVVTAALHFLQNYTIQQ